MTVTKIDPDTDDYTGKHIVINCSTGEVFACDTHDEADALAADHAAEMASDS